MTLLELCEPLFRYVCWLNRTPRKGGHLEMSRVRSEIVAMMENMRAKAAASAELSDQYEKIELVLLFFVDFMVKESDLGFAKEWNELAYERNELAGDEKLFDLLDETLNDSSQAATERLAIFYTCIGLGFTGWYTGQPEYLRKKMLEISARIHGKMDLDEATRICPEAYEHVDTSDLVEPAGTKLLGIGIALIGLLIVLFVANIFLFKWTSEDLTQALDKIAARDSSPQVTQRAESSNITSPADEEDKP